MNTIIILKANQEVDTQKLLGENTRLKEENKQLIEQKH